VKLTIRFMPVSRS